MLEYYLKTGARLHLGQFDLNGSLGRLYGGSGLAIDVPELFISAQKSDHLEVICADPQERTRAEDIALQYMEQYGLAGARLKIGQTLPEHSGLGSGTQLCLAIGFVLTRLYGMEQPLGEVAAVTDRENSRSGIGVAAFAQGGFIVDGGRRVDREAFGDVPPLLARHDFPDAWSVLLALPKPERKIHGEEEKNAFLSLPPMDEAVSGAICRLLLLKVLPSLQEQDLESFGDGITRIQQYVGDYFAPVQGGRYGAPICCELAAQMMAQGIVGVGASSWGPMIYGFVTNEQAQDRADKLRAFLGDRGQVWIAKGRNSGASFGWREAGCE